MNKTPLLPWLIAAAVSLLAAQHGEPIVAVFGLCALLFLKLADISVERDR